MAVTIYKFENGLALIIGGGVEIEPSELLPLLHIGLEYEKEFAEVWEVGNAVTHDFKWEACKVCTFGLSIFT